MRLLLYCIGVLFLISCQGIEKSKKFVVSNSTDLERVSETISIDIKVLEEIVVGRDLADIVVREVESKEILLAQWIDYDQNGTPDELIFQVSLMPNEKKEFEALWVEGGREMRPEAKVRTFSRLVPERTDDYTWENDKVAFRTFGPEAQRLVEAGEPGGTLSSGIDLWLKKVSYPIIDLWYAKNSEEPGYYHIEHGEGHDPYHVGKSRGAGGTGVWMEDTLVTSKNFIAYRTIATGPIRTVFELDYAPWSEFGINETKRVSLDLGSQFSKFEITLNSEKQLENYAIGITLHEGDGEVLIEEQEAWVAHWEKIADTYLGEGILLDNPKVYKKAFVHESDIPDQTQLLLLVDPSSVLTYYAGFGWSEFGGFETSQDWESAMKKQSEILKNPLTVEVK